MPARDIRGPKCCFCKQFDLPMNLKIRPGRENFHPACRRAFRLRERRVAGIQPKENLELGKMGLRCCIDCHSVFSTNNFYRSAGRLKSYCKECARTRTRSQYAKNPEYYKAISRMWARTERGKLAVRRATTKWRLIHPEHMTAAREQWAASHPEEVREIVRRRRARLHGLPVKANAAIVQQRIAFYGWRCWICRAPFKEVDHVKPIAAGGAHIGANLRPICVRCNRCKNHQWPFDVSKIREASLCRLSVV